ncbi:DUF222 domain-containing protein [Mycobacterium marseillense]|uniref:DUF222 domain-containing protein n=1 Tax=Mycobacterium marseillense TaxID=701042 RepID=UPI003FD8E52D
MSSIASADAEVVTASDRLEVLFEELAELAGQRNAIDGRIVPSDRLEVLFEELAELAGQRNAIDGRIVQIVAEIDRDQLCGVTGARSVPALVAWKLGCSSGNAHTISTIAGRLEEFPRCAAGMREGRLSADQVGVIAAHAGQGSDDHYAQLAAVATVNQLRTAVKLEPRPDPEPRPEPERSFIATATEQGACYRRSPRSISCAPRSSWNRVLTPNPGPSPSGRLSRPPPSRGRVIESPWATWMPRNSTPRWPRIVTRSSPSGAATTARAPAWAISVRRCRARPRRSCVWWRRVGMPRPPAAPTGSTPPWWPTSTSSGALPRCIWVRCCPTPNAAT